MNDENYKCERNKNNMKKTIQITAFAAAAITAAAMLCGCGSEKAAAETVWRDVNSGLTRNTEKVIPAETVAVNDENGRIILVSDDDRLVYKTDSGYAVFIFNGSYVGSAYTVYSFSDGVAADKYIQENATDIMSDGTVVDIERQGELVVLRLNMSDSKYIKYLSEDRGAVEKEFEGFEKQ